MDARIDYYVNFLSPTYLGLIAMYYYNKFTKIAEPVYGQVLRTYNALCTSFETKGVLYFYEGLYLPMNTLNNSTHSEKIRWYYILDKNLFVESLDFDNDLDTKKISWLSAEIFSNNEQVADISDFISDIRYVSSDGLPPTVDILLGLWSYQNGLILRRGTTVLNVINDSADSFTFDFIVKDEQRDDWLKSL